MRRHPAPHRSAAPAHRVDPTFSLETERFLLRPLSVEDVSDRWLAWLADPDTMEPAFRPRRITAEKLRAKVSAARPGRLLIGIFERQSGNHVGFYRIALDGKQARLSVVIGEKEARGGGIVVETRAALLGHLFGQGIDLAVGTPPARHFASVQTYVEQGWYQVQVESTRGLLRFEMTADKWNSRRSEPSDGA